MEHDISRVQVIDALLGFAIFSIMLLHNLKYFDYACLPADLPGWMTFLDKVILECFFFLFTGKFYVIFALIFGLTYYIQSKNQETMGQDFRLRFAWRMILLFGFGLIKKGYPFFPFKCCKIHFFSLEGWGKTKEIFDESAILTYTR